MTVQELIDELTKLPDKSLFVSSEGCDCIGNVSKVSVETMDDGMPCDPYVLLNR